MAAFGIDDDALDEAAEAVMRPSASTESPSLPNQPSTDVTSLYGNPVRVIQQGIGEGNHPNSKANLRPWRKGQSGNPLGPRAGSRHVQQAQAELRKAAPEAARSLIEVARDNPDVAQRVRSAMYVVDQALGKAVSRTEALNVNLDVSGADSQTLLAKLTEALAGAGIDPDSLIEGEWTEIQAEGTPDVVPGDGEMDAQEGEDAK